MYKNKLTLGIVIRSIIFWVFAIGAGCIITLNAILTIPFNVRFRHKISTKWAFFYAWLIRIVCNVDYEVIGAEHILSTPCIIASNHQSMWETMMFNMIFPQHVWITKRELLKVPLFGWTMATLVPIAIDRSNRSGAMAQIITQGFNRIKLGFSIMVYPEGTRVPPGAPDVAFKNGVGRMAKQFNIPILPVSHNAGYIIPKKSLWIYPGKVTIKIAEVISPDACATSEQLTKHLENIVKTNAKALLRQK